MIFEVEELLVGRKGGVRIFKKIMGGKKGFLMK
jgi:hypothetical protein